MHAQLHLHRKSWTNLHSSGGLSLIFLTGNTGIVTRNNDPLFKQRGKHWPNAINSFTFKWVRDGTWTLNLRHICELPRVSMAHLKARQEAQRYENYLILNQQQCAQNGYVRAHFPLIHVTWHRVHDIFCVCRCPISDWLPIFNDWTQIPPSISGAPWLVKCVDRPWDLTQLVVSCVCVSLTEIALPSEFQYIFKHELIIHTF